MESMEASVVVVVPPGFRFHPTEEELVGYYLKKKVAAQKIDLDVIREIDLYRIEPWDLQDRCWIGYEEQNEWYFFSHKDKKYPTGTRTNRATMAGFWKATGRDKAVYEKMRLIGMRKTLVFYKGRAPNGHKTDWIMHEYRLESDENGSPQEEGWVVCKAFKKRATGQTRNNERGSWESSCFYDEAGGISSILDPIEYISRKQPRPQSFICKQELEADNLILLESDHYVQLPQLERRPSLPVLTRQNIMSLVSENVEYEEQMSRCNNMEKRVTDWRALDKFVASQLSHDEERDDGEGVSNFGDSCNDNSDMSLILPQNSSTTSGREQEDYKLNGFLNSSSDCDFGICIFDK